MVTRTHPDNVLSSLRGRNAVLACAALLAVGCHRNGANGSVSAGFGAQPEAGTNAHVTSVVNNAVVTDRLATSTLERKQATPGSRFVVLDITARNTDQQPQVFSEGKLVNVSESHERTFATPVSMLTGEYLTLQVLNPASSVHGKIAYEVPEDLAGVLYWVPGNGNERILLHVATATTAVTTSAHAQPDSGIAEQDVGASAATKQPAIDRPARPAVDRVAATPPSARNDSPAPAATPRVHEDTRVASVTPPAHSAPAPNEQARRLACGALVSRNDPAEKPRYLGFFSRECEGYAMPSAWMSDAAASSIPSQVEASHVEPSHHEPVGAPRWPPRPGPAFDCNQAYSRAEHLVCEDAVLSLMDWELSRAYANASRRVNDPAALQRDEDDWRHRVRDACDTSRCVESAYNQRTAVLEAVAQER